jgi:protocatechuate 3,4-dioxygenase beta subunit
MRIRSVAFTILAVAAWAVCLDAAERTRSVSVRVEPPQDVTAIVLRSGEQVLSVPVSNGKALIPVDFALPWTVGLTAFEPMVYTKADLDAAKPLLIRQLGRIQGTLRRDVRTKNERFSWLLQVVGSDQPRSLPFTVGDDETFLVSVPAGIYEGALIGTQTASRIRSGIIVQPGRATLLGEIAIEPAVPVSIRVVDAKRGSPIAGARLTWSPPGEKLNADVSRRLYAMQWRGVTDRNGVATIQTVGPVPLSIRWQVDAEGYAPGETSQVQLSEPKRAALPDTRMRAASEVIVRVLLPREARSLRNTLLVLGENRDPRSFEFVRLVGMPLREGERRFTVEFYGKKRLWIENIEGKKIWYHDFDVSSETTVVDLVPQAVNIHGRVVLHGQGVADILVTLADPHDARTILAQATTDEAGDYRFNTFQAGELFLYTIGKGGIGRQEGKATLHVDATGRTDVIADLELADSGFILTVLDAMTNAPVKAVVRSQIESATGRTYVTNQTDAEGKLSVTGYPNGTANLQVQAKGYTSQELQLPLTSSNTEKVVRLQRSGTVSGRVVSVQGAGIRGARITGGYPSELEVQSYFSATTGPDGRFEFDSAPPPGTTFYVAAPGYALGLTTLTPNRENVVTLHPPAAGIVTLRPDNAPPTKVYMVMAAPAGDDFIPLGVMEDLAEVNGMSTYQLNGTALDGSLVLPEFLGPGTYHLYLALRGGKPFVYERIGTITTPLAGNVAIAYKPKAK